MKVKNMITRMIVFSDTPFVLNVVEERHKKIAVSKVLITWAGIGILATPLTFLAVDARLQALTIQ
ncbi:hypothetical protein OUZ56_005703 [Daphnia magna]|uniref:Uncharacterized protein n=1 Tax=Daphnia magna TaxID=35525 RepID=A0ABQ9YTJ0_9CRUS|nr:hypothetical protein OUZ56_005703 [Daphnia magna]